jgi:ParB/RepB/Spo0J family partition protein
MTRMHTAATPALDERFAHVPLDLIDPSEVQPRTIFPPAYLEQLRDSVADKGVLEPVLLRPKAAGRFEIVAGECRTRAARLAGLTQIPAVVRSYTDEQVLEIQLEENIHRKNLTPLEEAVAYRRLIATNPDKHTAASIATRIGMSVSYVWDYLKLNDLIPEAKAILAAERMTVGHAILIARLKPEDQARAIDPANGRNGRLGVDTGLWTTDHAGLLDEEDDEVALAKDGYHGLKTVSVRELEVWIRDHVRFDVAHMAKAQPLVFEQTAAKVEEAAAKPGRGKKVIAITNEYRVADDARDLLERTYGSQAWQRADGQEKSKTCTHSVLGVFAAGDGYGQTLEVCIARDRCEIHFAQVIRDREKTQKLRDAGKGKQADKKEQKQAESSDAKWKREQAEQETRRVAWAAIQDDIVADAVAQVKSVKTLTAAQAAALLKWGGELGGQEIRQHLGAKWFKSLAAALLVSVVTDFQFRSYNDKRSGFDQFIQLIAKPFGLNVKRLDAIRKKNPTGGSRERNQPTPRRR